ncbi:hypothetical protein [Tenacibaculum insulae]|uniref:hypothetical protein n=1 Tax=Tenacibaculum insulae TaxID=2029677 RepID=UPI003AB1127D
MKTILNLFVFLISVTAFSQYEYAVSKEYPYGKYNPKAPKEVKDYEDLIGECICKSERRKPDGLGQNLLKQNGCGNIL